MAESNVNRVPISEGNTRQPLLQGSADISDLHKAHIRLVALQRNVNGLLLQYRDMQQELAKAEAEFQALRAKVQEETGLIYNDQTLALEPKSK